MILKGLDAKRLVRDAIPHFNKDHHKLDEYVVAANHVHVLVTPKGKHTSSDILHSWMSFTSKELLKRPVAKRLTTAPTVWQKESWDHIVRSEASLNKFRNYIRSYTQAVEVSSLNTPMEEQKRDASATLSSPDLDQRQDASTTSRKFTYDEIVARDATDKAALEEFRGVEEALKGQSAE